VWFFSIIASTKGLPLVSRVMVANLYLANATRVTTKESALALFLPKVMVPVVLLSAPFVASAQTESSATGSALSAQHLSADWHQYVVQELQRAAGIAPQANSNAENLTDAIRQAFERDVRVALKLSDQTSVQIDVGSSRIADRFSSSLLRNSQGLSVSQSLSPTFVRQFGGTEVRLGGVFVYENFSSAGFGVEEARGGRVQSSTGSAALIGFSRTFAADQLGDVKLGASYQGRMRMDPFQNYRGLFSQPGRFDQPAKMTASLDYALSASHGLSFEVDRVNYSSVAPFTSRLLPDQFVSLLGDGGSPMLSWRDLTVYRAAYIAQLGDDTTVDFAVSSSLQPEPTSERLRRGLQPLLSEKAASFNVAHRFNDAAKLSLGASYMPFTYVLGPSLIDPSRFSDSSKVEAELQFEVSF
jgi:hypothetical protein